MIREMFCFQMRAHTDTRRPLVQFMRCVPASATLLHVLFRWNTRKKNNIHPVFNFFPAQGWKLILSLPLLQTVKKHYYEKNPHSLYHRNMPHLTSWDRIKHGHMARPVRDAWAQMGSCIFIHYSNECQQPITLRTNTQQPHTHRLPPNSRYIKCCGTSFHPCYENT